MSSKIKPIAEKLSIVALIFMLAISLVGGGTLAYKTRTGAADSEVSSGNISVKLLNIQNNGEDMPDLIAGILPGTTIPNVVKVENTCEYDEYIRIKLDCKLYDYNQADADLDINKVKIHFNENDWTYKDGYYYYNNVLRAGTQTEDFYNGILFDNTMNNKYKTACFDMNILVEAVQSINNSASVFDAQGWEVVYKWEK